MSKFTLMTVRQALSEAHAVLSATDTETTHLDASLLLAHVRGVDRAKLYMEFNEPLNQQTLESYRELISRRSTGEPVAWIVGKKEFWGRDFAVGDGVLCPRPDTETLVENALLYMDGYQMPGSIHDCCTGPGTIALSLAADRPLWSVSASDISRQAENYFRINNRNLCNSRVSFTLSDTMQGIPGPFDIIVSNPPYLSTNEVAERKSEGWKEPSLALDGGGTDGLNYIRRLIPAAAHRLKHGGRLMLEAHPLQMPIMKQILSENGFDELEVKQDLAGRNRVLIGRYSGVV